MRAQRVLTVLCWLLAFNAAGAVEKAAPLAIGETFTLQSKALNETRRINVYLPPGYTEASDKRFPVLYMPVGIENTERRRDLTGPTQNEEDKKIAPQVGGSALFRKFLRDELMPEVKSRYRTTDETAIVGESLAGLFIIETFLLEPDLFDAYIAIDPSLWWNDGALVKSAPERLRALPNANKWLWFASSSEERGDGTERLYAALQGSTAPQGLLWRFERMPEEKHATIYHPAALNAFRVVLHAR